MTDLKEPLLPKYPETNEHKEEKKANSSPETPDNLYLNEDFPIDMSDIPLSPPEMKKDPEEDKPYTPDGIPNWKQMLTFMTLTLAGSYGAQLGSPYLTSDESTQGTYNMAGFLLSALISAGVAKKVVPKVDRGIQWLGNTIYEATKNFCASSKLTTNTTERSTENTNGISAEFFEDNPPPQPFMKSISGYFFKSTSGGGRYSDSFLMKVGVKSLAPLLNDDDIVAAVGITPSSSNNPTKT